ncbi:MAG: hypothetical protein ACI9VR_001548 [Cognaticolwellia sp.]|jgi:hypothetical protein
MLLSLVSIACLRGVPPADLAQDRVPQIPLAPKGCSAAALIPVRGSSSCGLGGSCHAKGLLFTHAESLAVPKHKASCSVRYDQGSGQGAFTVLVRDSELVGHFVCMVDGGDWLSMELLPHAAPPSPEVRAFYGRGLLIEAQERPRFGRECKTENEAQNWGG